MKTRLLAVLLTAGAVPVAALVPAAGPRTGAATVQAPERYTYCPYSSSTRSTSASPPGGSCSTTSSTPSSL